MRLQKVSNLSQPELGQIVNLHLSVLKESTLNKFGPKFLKLVYQTALKRNNDIFLVLKDGRKIYGFALASTNVSNFYRQCLKENLSVVVSEVTKACFKNPVLALKIAFWILPKNETEYPAELQFIVIDPKFQKRGWGKKMIKAIDAYFKEQNISHYKVGTWASNEGSNNFYKKIGFKYLFSQKILGSNFNFYLSPELK